MGPGQQRTYQTSITNFQPRAYDFALLFLIPMAEYTYQPLLNTARPLRLLILLPEDSPEAETQCHVAIADLHDDPIIWPCLTVGAKRLKPYQYC